MEQGHHTKEGWLQRQKAGDIQETELIKYVHILRIMKSRFLAKRGVTNFERKKNYSESCGTGLEYCGSFKFLNLKIMK